LASQPSAFMIRPKWSHIARPCGCSPDFRFSTDPL